MTDRDSGARQSVESVQGAVSLMDELVGEDPVISSTEIVESLLGGSNHRSVSPEAKALMPNGKKSFLAPTVG